MALTEREVQGRRPGVAGMKGAMTVVRECIDKDGDRRGLIVGPDDSEPSAIIPGLA
jgi:hypothetical protein